MWAAQKARQLREELGLHTPIDVERVATMLNIRLRSWDIGDLDEVYRVRHGIIYIVTNVRHPYNGPRWRCLNAHALGHWATTPIRANQINLYFGFRLQADKYESYATQFAHELLMPAKELTRLWRSYPFYGELQDRFGVTADFVNARVTNWITRGY